MHQHDLFHGGVSGDVELSAEFRLARNLEQSRRLLLRFQQKLRRSLQLQLASLLIAGRLNKYLINRRKFFFLKKNHLN